MLLVVTNKLDMHSDEVIRRLNARRVPVFRLNTEDILDKYEVSLWAAEAGTWGGQITDELGRTIDLAAVRIAWIRRPEFSFDRLESSPDGGVDRFVAAEVRALVACLYGLPSIQFVNDVFCSQRARTKFQQLVHAAEAGVAVPRTIITTSPSQAERFADEASGDLLIKVVQTGNVERQGVHQALPSRRVTREQFGKVCALVRNAPTQIQDYIEKDYELRVTVVGSRVLAVKIESQVNEATRVDWRPQTTSCPHSRVELPERIERFCRDFVREQRLLFGALDFIVDPAGRYVFLENNPSGQYLWLEEATGVPITEALVELFVECMALSPASRT